MSKMNKILSEDCIVESYLTDKERERLLKADEARTELMGNGLRHEQDALLRREDKLKHDIAVKVGFDGYNTGDYNYCAEDIKRIKDSESITPETKQRFTDFLHEELRSEEWKAISNEARSLKEREHMQQVWLKQLYLNDVLTTIRHRYKEYHEDAYGNPVMGKKKYDELTSDMKEQLRRPVQTELILKNDSESVVLDKSIYQLSFLWKDGIVTGESCSGMVEDHPYHRLLADDKYGLGKVGENEFMRGSKAYVTFPIEDNHPGIVDVLNEKAQKWGWVVDKENIQGRESLVLRQPWTLDGTAYSQIKKEAETLMVEISQNSENKDVEQARIEAFRKVEENHGGRVDYTDEMTLYAWRQMFRGLEEAKELIDKKTLEQNKAEGKSCKVYFYDSSIELNAKVLSEVFRRSGLVLDKDSMNRQPYFPKGLQRVDYFMVKNGEARLMDMDEPLPDRTVLEAQRPLSALMASQMKGTASTYEDAKGNYFIKAMVHPEPEDLETMEVFTMEKSLAHYQYYNFNGIEDNDRLYDFIGRVFTDDLYLAAGDAYDKSFQKELDEVKQQQAVSDIRIRKGIDGNPYISCNVYGERQLAKKMKPEHFEYNRMRMSQSDKAFNGVAPELAQKYYAKEIADAQLDREQSQGMKR